MKLDHKYIRLRIGRFTHTKAVSDASWRAPHASEGNKWESGHVYEYDAEGNLTRVVTSRVMADGHTGVAEGVHSDPTQPYWTVYSRSIGVSVGLGASTGVTGGASMGVGTVRFLGNQKVGQPKGFWETALSLTKLIH